MELLEAMTEGDELLPRDGVPFDCICGVPVGVKDGEDII